MSAKPSLFSSPQCRLLTCLLGALIAATLVTAGAGTYLPFNEIDRIGVPILLFPVTWTLLFLYAAMASKLWHVWLVLTLLSLIHIGLVYRHLAG